VLCGGCADVCPTQCLKLVPLASLELNDGLSAAIENSLGADADLQDHSAILKDEDRCIRCALCAQRCPADAITMERVSFSTFWRTA
jgi:NAD-dependent dihydropyrimidine dehydrogenase PreA subunit